MGAGVTSGECSEQDTVNISLETVSEWLYTPTDTVITTIVIPIIWCLAAITNWTFLFVMYRVPKLRSDTNIYLAHLALADLLYLSLGSVYDIWSYTSSPVAFHVSFVNSAQCISFFTIINTGYFASIALVTMVSFERYLALCHPIKHLKIRGRPRTYKMVATCWLVGLMFSVSTMPRVAIFNVQCLRWPDDDMHQEYPSSRGYCGTVAPWVIYYTQPLLNVPWLIAMVANIYMYVRILQMLNKRTGKNGVVAKNNRALKIRKQVAKMLIVNGVVFFLCQTPYRIFSLAEWICLLTQISNPLSAALGRGATWIYLIPQHINGMINPLIYGAINTMYRTAFMQAFRCKGQRRENVNSPLAISATRHTTAETLAIDENTETRL